MQPSLLLSQFEIAYRALRVNIAGITDEQSLMPPSGGGNCLNWVLGHLLHSRNQILRLLNQPEVAPNLPVDTYRRGAQPDDASQYRPFSELWKSFELTQERLKDGLISLSEQDLDACDPNDPDEWRREPLGETLLFFHFHESYHIGQTGLLRRLLGLKGVIR